MNINLHIERLILDGLPVEAGHGAAIREAVETELARLLAGEDSANHLSGGAVPSVRAAEIRLAQRDTPGQLGRQIAGSIYGGISKQNE